MNDKTLGSLPKCEWDALISSIIRPFLVYARKDPLITYEDLEQEAWVGLLSAVKNYDSTKAKFTTFAYLYMRGRMLRYILERTRISDNRLELDATLEPGYVDNSLEESELMDSIFSAVAEEPNAHFLIEYYVKGKSFRKIAESSDISHQGVATHIKRLVRLLEKRLSHENA